MPKACRRDVQEALAAARNALALTLAHDLCQHCKTAVEKALASGPPRPEGATMTTPVEGQIGDSQFGRILDPVRAAALHEAVQVWHTGAVEDDGNQLDLIVKTAKRFEEYLAGTDG